MNKQYTYNYRDLINRENSFNTSSVTKLSKGSGIPIRTIYNIIERFNKNQTNLYCDKDGKYQIERLNKK